MNYILNKFTILKSKIDLLAHVSGEGRGYWKFKVSGENKHKKFFPNFVLFYKWLNLLLEL